MFLSALFLPKLFTLNNDPRNEFPVLHCNNSLHNHFVVFLSLSVLMTRRIYVSLVSISDVLLIVTNHYFPSLAFL
jgi:hypothetical protein